MMASYSLMLPASAWRILARIWGIDLRYQFDQLLLQLTVLRRQPLLLDSQSITQGNGILHRTILGGQQFLHHAAR
jgi:hypothetical protein